ncbi:MAG: hypothetical protein R3344_11415 [Acidobacteriota bacterium]|nr:hypothetical protein [Acidobacteriota bacterium]
MNPPPLQADVVLRDVAEDDLPILFAHQMDPVAYRLAAFTPRDREAFMKHWKDNILGDPAATKKTILYGGEVAGYVTSFDRADKREIGYWIGREGDR